MTKGVCSRMLVLLALIGLLVALRSPDVKATAADQCAKCDANFTSCRTSCNKYPPDSANYASCLADCGQNYTTCLQNCLVTPPVNGGGRGCGRGKTSCEVGCANARKQCVLSGGTTCGAAYNSCEHACCP
jgi:hypothetical protein